MEMQSFVLKIDVHTPGATAYAPTLTALIPTKHEEPLPAVIVFAGGGYRGLV